MQCAGLARKVSIGLMKGEGVCVCVCVCVCVTHLHMLRVFEVWSDVNQAISPWEWGELGVGCTFSLWCVY